MLVFTSLNVTSHVLSCLEAKAQTQFAFPSCKLYCVCQARKRGRSSFNETIFIIVKI